MSKNFIKLVKALSKSNTITLMAMICLSAIFLAIYAMYIVDKNM